MMQDWKDSDMGVLSLKGPSQPWALWLEATQSRQ